MRMCSYIQCLPQIPIVVAVPNLSSADVNRIIQAISCAITVRPNGNELSTEPSVSGTLAAHHNTNSSSSVSSQETERFECASDGNGGRQLTTRLTRSYSRDGFEFSGGSQCSSQDSQSGELSTDVSSRNRRSLRGQGEYILGPCSNAMNILQRARGNAGANAGVGTRYSQLFLREAKRKRQSEDMSQKRPRTIGWTHAFYCLSECRQSVVPQSNYERDILLEAGLGEKKVFIPDVDASGEEFRSVLYQAFPKLKDAGGYAFGKCKANSRCIELLSSYCLTSPQVLRSRVGNTRTYIIPMQKNLSLSAVLTDVKANVFEKCLSCMKDVPFHNLNDHLAECMQPSGESSDEDLVELPSASHLLSTEVDMSTSGNTSELPVTTLRAALEEISGRVEDVECIFEVRREHIIEDCFENVTRSEFNPAHRIQVVFLGEEAEDYGGPRRELWRLFEFAVKEKYFEGNESEVIPRHDTVALQNNTFYKIGTLIALSIAQGGSGFPYLFKGVYEYLSCKEPNSITISTSVIPDYTARSCVEKITQATTEESVQLFAREYSEMVLESGFTKAASAITLADRDNLIKSLCLHHTIFKCKAELDQLKEGLHTLGVAAAIKVLPDTFECLFTTSEEVLTPEKLKEIFQGRISFSSGVDSVKIAKEHVAYTYFCEYLEDCFKGDSVASLEQVLIFFTGASRVPPGGFNAILNQPSMSFDHQSLWPQASTCALKLILPVHNKYEDFKAKMDEGVTQRGFGYA